MTKTDLNPLQNLPEKKQEELKELTTRIKCLLRSSSNDLIKIGEHLTRVRNIVPRRHFSDWLKSSTPYSRSHGYRLINAFRVFGKADVRKNIDPSALYLLSQPSTPTEAQAYAAQLARNKAVTYTDAVEIIRVHRTSPEEVARDASRRRQGKERFKELAWDEMEKALKAGARVRVEFFNEDGNPYFYVVVNHEDQEVQPKYVPGPLLSLAMLEALGKTPKKQCLNCQQPQPVTMYSNDSTREDGLSNYCQQCENRRHKQMTADRRREAAYA